MTFCQGNITMMTDDLPAAIRRFGEAGRIHFVHFRDVRGTPESFVETFVDEGPTDMAACIRAYLDAGRRRAAAHRPLADARRRHRASCRAIRRSGRLHAIGYVQGLLAVGGEAAACYPRLSDAPAGVRGATTLRRLLQPARRPRAAPAAR